MRPADPAPKIPRTSSWPTLVVAAGLAGASLTAGAAPALAQGIATRVTVRAVAHDAKLIGSGVGGARIVILDAEGGDTLAAGLQKGGTGDTDLIMRRPHERGRAIYDTEGAAGFTASLPLAVPTRVRIVAEGPLGNPDATVRASITTLLAPGRDVSGDGIVLDLYGLAVSPQVPASAGAGPLPVRATVTMLCGCPITPGGLWDAGGVDVRARLVRDGKVVAEAPLAYAGSASTFEGRLTPPGPGEYRLVVLASEPSRANFGQAVRPVRVGGGS